MTLRLLSLTLLAAVLSSASAQNRVPGGTPLLAQPPQTQVQPAVTFVLAYPLLAMPETSPVPSRVKLTLSRPAESLDISGQPRGMTATVTQDTVTVETKGVPVGQYPLRITGRWGNETKAVELLVSVYAMNGTVAPITGPAEPGPTVPTPAALAPKVTPLPVEKPATATPPVAPKATSAAPSTVKPLPTPTPSAAPASANAASANAASASAAPASTVPLATAPVITAPAPLTPPLTPVVPPEIRPSPSAPATTTLPVFTPDPVAAPVRPPDVPRVAPATPSLSAPPLASTGVPYQTPPLSTADSGGRFTVWGGMGTERGIVGGLNVGVSSRVAQISVFQVAVRGTAELYPTPGSGLGLPVIGADVLLSRQGSRLYYGPSTSLAFGSGNSWAIGGLVGYSSTWNKELGYYLEGRARYAHLGGQNSLSPGFRVGFTYKLNR